MGKKTIREPERALGNVKYAAEYKTQQKIEINLPESGIMTERCKIREQPGSKETHSKESNIQLQDIPEMGVEMAADRKYK